MKLAGIRAGDIVEVEIRGLPFLARVEDKQQGELRIAPLCSGISYRAARARQVLVHWRRSGR
jgi:hypothetical protein